MNYSDFLLLEKIRNSDYHAFQILYEKYYQLLFNFSKRFVIESFIADDIVQDVFIKIWEKRKGLRISEDIKSYLFSAVKNTSLNYLKSEQKRAQHTNIHSIQNQTIINQSEIELEEFRNYLLDCIYKLPPRCLEVFKKSRFDGLKQDKIADSLNITKKTVKAQVGKALRLIKECINKGYPEFL